MTLEELMNVEIDSGTLTGIEQNRYPGTITVITSEQIYNTPARNIYDLIETYVPGATYVSHYQGLRLGIRGSLSDQNYSYQLLLNGKDINMNSFYGAMFELHDKELGFIDRIEIISGSGSATYGPGATAGMINIITKSPDNKSRNLGYLNIPRYHSEGKSFSVEDNSTTIKYYIFGSMNESKGLDDTKYYYVDRAYNFNENKPWGWGFMGSDWGNFERGTPAPNFLSDYQGKPEVKFHLNAEFSDNISLSTHYSTYNHTLMTQQTYSSDGPAFNGQHGKLFLGSLQWKKKMWNDLKFKSSLNFKSISYRSVNMWQRDGLAEDHIAQLSNSFSENALTYSMQFNYNHSENAKFALGSEFMYQFYRPEWGEDDESFILSLQAPIRFAVLNENSKFRQFYGDSFTTVISDDIDCNQYSFFGEANITFTDYFQSLFSFRADKNEYSDFAISPRIAFIGDITENNTLELIFDRSVRLPLLTEMYAQNYLGADDAKPEIRTGSEIVHILNWSKNLNMKSSLYYYSIDQISWINDSVYTDVIGTFDLLGFETSINYSKDKLSMNANYSFINQINWDQKLNTDAWIVDSTGTTYMIDGSGENRINNLPAQTLKTTVNYDISDNLRFHMNGQLMWNFQQSEMLDKFNSAHNKLNDPVLKQTMKEIEEDLEEHGYGKPSFTSNFAFIWSLPNSKSDLKIKLFSQNLISYNHIRYVIQFWETGDVKQFPRQCGFIEEPMTIGLKLEYKF